MIYKYQAEGANPLLGDLGALMLSDPRGGIAERSSRGQDRLIQSHVRNQTGMGGRPHERARTHTHMACHIGKQLASPLPSPPPPFP